MATSLWEPQSRDCRADDSRKVQVTILASEWGSSKGGLSTINREIAIHLAKCPEVEITFFLPQCSQEDKKVAMEQYNIKIIEATPLPGHEQLDWLCVPPADLQIDIIIGHGVKLGKQVPIIKSSKRCKWVQVVHTDQEELGMFTSYSNPISEGEEKHKAEVKLCEMADHVVLVGPKLSEAFHPYLRGCKEDDNVVNFTPGVIEEFATVKQASSERQQRSVLVFGRGDVENFELKGFDIAGRAVAELKDTHLVFVGAPDGKKEEIAKWFQTKCDVPAGRVRVRRFQDRESLRRLFQEVDLVVMPSRAEGFGFAGLEGLSAGLPVLVSGNSGFGKALCGVPFGSTYVVDSDNPTDWTSAIKTIFVKDRRKRLEETETLRKSYGKKYNWAKQIKDLIDKMISLVYDDSLTNQSSSETKRRICSSTDKATQHMERTTLDPEGSKIIRTSEDSASRSKDSDGSTLQLTTDFPEGSTRRSDGVDGSAPQLTSRLPSCVNSTASNAVKPIRGPPEPNKVFLPTADIKTITQPSKDADQLVDVTVMQEAKGKRHVAEDSDEEDSNMAQVIAVAGAAVHKALGAIDDLLSSGKGQHNLVVGKQGPGDILLFKEQKRQVCGFGYVSHIYRHNGDNTITAVVAKDNWDDDTGGDPKIIDGGLGQKHVEVKVTSRFGRGFNHTVYVYGKEEN